MRLKIKYINYGIACRIGNLIYLNKNLKNYPNLLKNLIRHEKAHSSGYKFKDLLIDLHGRYLSSVKKDYYKFIIKNPSSWIQFLPLGYYDGTIVYDITLIIVWVMIGVIVGVLS